MPCDMDTSTTNADTDLNVGDERPPGFTPAFSFPMDPSNAARQDEFTCVGCHRLFGTKRLLCSHTVCNVCYRRSEIGVICQLCGSVTPFNFVRDTSATGQQELRSIMENAVRCACPDKVAAAFYCYDCDEFLCVACREAHSVGAPKDHVVEELTEGIIPPIPPSALCPVHPAEELSLFCHQCQCMTCIRCMMMEHQDHQERRADLANNVEAQRNLLRMIVDCLPQKAAVLRRRQEDVKARMQKMEQIRTAARGAVEKVREALLKRFEDLVNEIDRRCREEEAFCAGVSKTTRNMIMVSSYIKRLAGQACQGEQMSEEKSVLHLLDFVFARLKVMNETLDQQWQKSISTVSILVNQLTQQAARIGTLDTVSSCPQQCRAFAPPAASVDQAALVQHPLPRPYRPTIGFRPGNIYALPQSSLQRPQQYQQQQQQYQQQEQYQRQQPLQYRQQQLQYGTYRAPYYQPAYYAPSLWPSCAFQKQPVPVVQFPVNMQQQQACQMATPPQQQQQAPVDLSSRYRGNAINVPTAQTPPAINSVVAPPSAPSSSAMRQVPSGQSQDPLRQILPSATLYSVLSLPGATGQTRSPATAKRGRGGARSTSRTVLPKPTGQSTVGDARREANSSTSARRGAKANCSVAVAGVPMSVRLVVDEVAKNRRANLEIARGLLAQSSSPLYSICTAPVANIVQNPGLISDDAAATSVLVNSNAPSPEEPRLIIDESDSGVESAITVEEESEPGMFNTEIKQEVTGARSENRNTAVGEIASWQREEPADGPHPEQRTAGNSSTLEEEFWEEFCSVCNEDDGRAIRRCSNRQCGKLFHGNHHLPPFDDVDSSSGTNDSWLCTFCVDLEALKLASDMTPDGQSNGLTAYQQKACERILLELYTCSESMWFHQPAEKSLPGYYEQIRHPMDFATIGQKLVGRQYLKTEEFLVDLNLAFNNCYVYYKDLNPDICAAGAVVGEVYRHLVAEYFPKLIARVVLLPLKRKIANAIDGTGQQAKKTRQE